jgi:small subunit ribosomal protein S3
MGQKVHPESLRVGYIHDWKANWFNEKLFSDYLHEDEQIRNHIVGRLSHAGLSDITIRKNATEVEVNINTARPGIVIGKSGSEVDALRRNLHQITGKQVKVNILEIKRPELDARLVAQSIAEQLQNRVAFRRAMKRALTSAMRSGAKGVKVQVSGRLGGAEMARTESYSDGRVPLHTLRADIDYGFYEAKTTFGRIGVKCWVNKGEIMPEGYTGADLTSMDEPSPQAGGGDRPGRDGRDGRGRGRGGRGGQGAGGPGGQGGAGGGGGRGRGGQGGGAGGGRGGFGGQGGGGGGRGGFGGGGGGGGRGAGGAGGGGRGPGGAGGGGGGGRGPGGAGGGGGGRGPSGPSRGGQSGGGQGGGGRGPRPGGAGSGAPSGGVR